MKDMMQPGLSPELRRYTVQPAWRRDESDEYRRRRASEELARSQRICER